MEDARGQHDMPGGRYPRVSWSQFCCLPHSLASRSYSFFRQQWGYGPSTHPPTLHRPSIHHPSIYPPPTHVCWPVLGAECTGKEEWTLRQGAPPGGNEE